MNHKRGITLIELLAALTVIGILTAMLLPAVNAARHSALRTQCMNNLRQIGIAHHGFLNTSGTFPSAGSTMPWTVQLAPFLEQEWLLRSWDYCEDAYSSPTNSRLATQSIGAFLCPSVEVLRTEPNGWVVSNYACNSQLLGMSPAACIDGLSHTVLGFEVAGANGMAWATGPALLPGSYADQHCDIQHQLLADGSIVSASGSMMDKTGTF